MNITANMIRTLQLKGTEHAALIEREDGSVLLVGDLPAYQDEHGDHEPVLRHPAKAWADDLVALARIAAEEDGTSTKVADLRAAAAVLANDELAEDRAREEAVVPTPPQRPQLAGLPSLLVTGGRRQALPTPEQVEAEAQALCDLLDELEDAGLIHRAA